MNERLKMVRLELCLSQEEFGSKLGIKRSAVSKLENGDNNLTDSMIKLVCREYSVDEEWLRTGNGKMFLEVLAEDEYIRAAMELSREGDDFAMRMLIEYWKLDTESKKLFRNFIKKISREVE